MDEDDLFFGRNEQIDDILLRLKTHQFLGIVGSSGCGKSSVIKAGVLPALQSGLMGKLGCTWHIADMKPGDTPILNLAIALLKSGVLGQGMRSSEQDVSMEAALLAANLRQSDVSLVRLLSERQLPEFTNLVILADQFEEIFRFQQRDPEEAIAFVNLLLATARNQQVRAFVLLTMRSDFLGQCAAFPGLPEALNDSQYLCPRLTRTQLREAIQLPALVAGGEVSDQLASQLVNDAGANSDQLPLIQHALSRMWHLATARLGASAADNVPPIHLTPEDYRQAGGLTKATAAGGETPNALSVHLDEVYAELQTVPMPGLSSERAQWIAQMVFRSLAERGSGGQLIRSPRPVSAMAGMIRQPGQSLEQAVADVVQVVEHFRRGDRSFLVPPQPVLLTADSLLDISHEALIRQWQRLSREWLDEEDQARRRYRRLSEAADSEATAGLMRDPELSFLEQWWQSFAPREVWADQTIPGSFGRTSSFLRRSREALDDERRRYRNRMLLWGTVGLLLAGLLLWERSRSIWRAEGENYAQRFLANPDAFAEDLEKYRKVAQPIFREQYDAAVATAQQRREKLHAAYGLAKYTPTAELLQFLGDEVGRLDAVEFTMLSRSLKTLLQALELDAGIYVRDRLKSAVDRKERQLELRWLLVGLALGETTALDAYCAAKPDPSDTTELMVDLLKIPIDVTWLSEVLSDEQAVLPATRYVLCLAVGGLQGNGAAARETLEKLYQTAPDGGTHGAARWALRQQGVSSAALDQMIAGCSEVEADSGHRNWYVTPLVQMSQDASSPAAAGFTMLQIESVPEFWLSDREVSIAQFRALCPERFDADGKIDGVEVQDGAPVRFVTWYEPLIFCNRLSRAHGIPEYYRMDEGDYDWMAGTLNGDAMFPTAIDPNGRGYRLPTEREWEYACRALSSTAYSFGSEANQLPLFAWYLGKESPAICGEQRPSRWGLSDMHGNVWEWCWDSEAADEQGSSSSRVLRGGSFDGSSPVYLRSAIRLNGSPGNRDDVYGFRLFRTK